VFAIEYFQAYGTCAGRLRTGDATVTVDGVHGV
jgi:hypothetical protein